MRALQLTAWRQEPEIREIPLPEPGPGQVVVKVGGAGACNSDLHIMESTTLPWDLPMTIGHEGAGWVHSLGSGVDGLEVGQPVAVHGAWGCGRCSRCLAGLENYCEMRPPTGGLGIDGAMAEYLLVPAARHLVPLPDGLGPVAAAPLTDAGLTPYHAVRRSWPKLVPSATAVVIGIGGLGHLAVQVIGATTGARVLAVDPKPDARELALSHGAEEAFEPEEAAAAIRESTGGRGSEVVLDFVGTDATLGLAMSVARPLGDVTVVGIAGGSFAAGFYTMPYEVSLQTMYWGTRAELVEVLDLAARGRLRAEHTTYPLDRAVEAYRDLHAGAVRGRAVIIPNRAP